MKFDDHYKILMWYFLKKKKRFYVRCLQKLTYLFD